MDTTTKRSADPPSALHAGLFYLRRAISIIPIRSRGDVDARKKTLLRSWEPYQRRLPTEEEVRRWLSKWPDANLGLVTGAVSGCWTLDLDRDAEALLKAHNIVLPNTPTARTGGGGRHILFKHPGKPIPNGVKVLVAPASDAGKAPQADVRGDGGYIVVWPSLHGSGKRYEWEIPLDVPFADAPAGLLELVLSRQGAPDGPKDPSWAVSALVGPIPEGARNDTATRLAGHFLAKSKNNVDEVVALLTPWARTVCVPPMDLRELRKTVESVARRERAKASQQGMTTDGKGSLNALVLLPLRDLLDEPEETVRWVLAERLPSGGLSIFVARPKGGKSTTARCLALAVARGLDFLEWATVQGPVFYLALEEKRAEVRAHFRAMGATKDDQVFVFIAPSPQDGLAQLREAAERHRPALIIVDPILKLVRVKDANDYAQVSLAFEPLLTLARETGAHVMAIHHLGKGERSGGDAILGSTAIFAAVDTALILKRTEKYRTLSSIQRYGEDLEETVLVLDPVTRTLSAGPSRKEADEGQMAEAILEYLRGKQDQVEEAEIHEAVEGRKVIKVRALRALLESRKVSRTGAGKRGDPYRYSISSSLVPTYIREPENQKSKVGVSGDDCEAYSGSGQNGLFGEPGKAREPDSEGHSGGSF